MRKNSRTVENSDDISTSMPASSPEAQENRCIALANDRVEERLRNGTATSQEICYFLKLGSPSARLDKEIKEEELKLIKAKTEALQAEKDTSRMYKEALEAFGVYSGKTQKEDYDD